MNVLINKSILRKDLSALSSKNGYVRKSDVMQILGEQKCAYNPDKVVEQLEQKMKRARDKEQKNTSEYFEGEADGFEFAIEIVKGGGVDGKKQSQ